MNIQQFNNPYLWYLIKPTKKRDVVIEAYKVQRKVEPVFPSHLGKNLDQKG